MTTITEQNLRDALLLAASFGISAADLVLQDRIAKDSHIEVELKRQDAQMRFDAALAEAVAELEKMPNVSESYEQYVRSEMVDGRSREKFDPTDC